MDDRRDLTGANLPMALEIVRVRRALDKFALIRGMRDHINRLTTFSDQDEKALRLFDDLDAARAALDEIQVELAKLDATRCNSGHDTLPLRLWDCPTCRDERERRARAAAFEEAVRIVEGVLSLNMGARRMQMAIARLLRASAKEAPVSDERTFPILVPLRSRLLRSEGRMDCPHAVPWALAEHARKQAEKNHRQTLERLAERGGLSPTEFLGALFGKDVGFILRHGQDLKDHGIPDLIDTLDSFRLGVNIDLSPELQKWKEAAGE